MSYKVKSEFNWSARMGMFPGDIYIVVGLALLAVATYSLRADPDEVAKERESFFKKLYAKDALRNSRQ
jgi:hypothetical protein